MNQYWLKNPPYIRGFQQAPLPYSPSLGGTWYIVRKEGSEKKYQIGDTPYEKFATFAVLQTSNTPHINITVL